MAHIDFDVFAAELGETQKKKWKPLPDGRYRACIIESDIKPNKKGTGKILKLTFEIMNPEPKVLGRKVWKTLNIENASETAQNIARRELQEITFKVKLTELHDSYELHNVPLTIILDTDVDMDGDPMNVIKGYDFDEFVPRDDIVPVVEEDDGLPF